jgi:hypothetical protein
MTKLEEVARAIARVMNGSICPDVRTADDVPLTPEDLYAAAAAIAAMRVPDEGMIEAGFKAERGPLAYAAGNRRCAVIFTAMIDAIDPMRTLQRLGQEFDASEGRGE